MFCALLIVVWGSYRLVGDLRLSEDARDVATGIFTFSYPNLAVVSQVESMNAQVINRNDHEALVKVSGRQLISHVDQSEEKLSFLGDPERVDCQADLIFYKNGSSWFLGKVELK